LSRVGFSVSYQHFPWQHSPYDIEHYYGVLAEGDNIEHFRSSSWANTPDILTEELQQGMRQVFIARAVLAATLSASYGIYGPVYELQVHTAVREKSEEYASGEKYEVRSWNLDDPGSLRGLLRTLNTIRRSHRALQHDRTMVFHDCDNPRLVAFSKTAAKRGSGDVSGSDDPVLVVCNTDYYNSQASVVRLDLRAFGKEYEGFTGAYEVEDLLTGSRYDWHGADNWVQLDPWNNQPAHVFAVRLPAVTISATASEEL
jgi:starch synthase (maltosyl-transferring)